MLRKKLISQSATTASIQKLKIWFQNGGNQSSQKTKVRSSHHSAQIFQKNGQREGYQRYLGARLRTGHIDFSCIVLRERYLRNDVSCGIQGCRECESETSSALPTLGEMGHPSFLDGHFVLPDTNVFLSQVRSNILIFFQYIDTATLQMDLVESPLFTPPIILLQTVIEEVRHRSLPLYNRLKALTRMDDKKIWIFYNEYRS